MVVIGDGKLIQQIALVDGVDLHAVAPGLLGQHRAVDHHIHQLMDLVLGHGPVLQLGLKHVGQLAGCDHRPLVVEIWKGQAAIGPQAPPHTRAQLHHQLGVGLLVELGHEILQRAVEGVLVLIQPAGPAPLVRQDGEPRDDQPRAALGAAQEELLSGLIELPVADQGGAAHGTQDQARRDGQFTHLERLKKCVVFMALCLTHVTFPQRSF